MSIQAGNIVDLILELQDRYREAVEVFARLPGDERRHLDAGSAWPAFRAETQPTDWHGLPRTVPTAAQIGRAEELLGWHCWLARQDGDMAKAVLFIHGVGMKTHLVAKKLHCDRRTVLRKRTIGLERLAVYVVDNQKKVA